MSDFARLGIEEEQRHLAGMNPDTFAQRFDPSLPGLPETYANAGMPYQDRLRFNDDPNQTWKAYDKAAENAREMANAQVIGPERAGPDWLYQSPFTGKETPLSKQIEQDTALGGLFVPQSIPEAALMAATGGVGRALGGLGRAVLGAGGVYGMATDEAQAGKGNVLGGLVRGAAEAPNVLRGAAAKAAWLGPDIEAKLASSKHPFSAISGTPIRDMSAPSYRETVAFDRPEINFDQLRPIGNKPQYAFVPSGGDASIAGKQILGAGGYTFEHPVEASGGPDFGRMMQAVRAPVPGNPNAFPVWQSQAAPIGGLLNVAKQVEAKGMQPLHVYTTGGKQYLDQSMQMVDTAIEGAKASGLSQKQIDHVNNVMRNKDTLSVDRIPDFPSLELLKHGEDGALAFYNKLLDYPQPVRAKFVKSMDSAEARSLGFPDMGALRVANTVPQLLTTPSGSMGFTISKLDPASGTFKNPYHPTYDTGIAGTEIYTLPGGVSVPPSEIVPTMHAARQDVGGKYSEQYRAQPHKFYPAGPQGSASYEPVTNEVLDRLQNYLRINPRGAAALGGTVAGAAGAAAMSPDQAEAAKLPRVFWRGTNPGDVRRIATGNPSWDQHLFMSNNPDDASMYGKTLTRYEASPDAKILVEGTPEWRKIAGSQRQGENLLEYSARAAEAAKAAGYDAAQFQRQSSVGTAVFNPDKFKLLPALGAAAVGAAAMSPDQAEAASLKTPPSFGGLVRGAAALPEEAVKMVKFRTPQGTMNEVPAWMKNPERWWGGIQPGTVIDPSMPMDLESRMARRANSPFSQDVYHFSGQRLTDPNRDLPVERTFSPNQFSQFQLDRPFISDFGIHVGTPGQAETRAYHQEHAMFSNPLKPEEGPLQSGGHTYPLAADFGPKGMLTATDETTWGPLLTKMHLQNTGQFTPEEIAKATAQLTPTEQLQAYRDLVRSHGYGGLQYRNQVEAEGIVPLEQAKDRLMMLRDNRQFREPGVSNRSLQNKIDDLEQRIANIKEDTTAKSYAIADPSQLRSRFMAIYDPRNIGKSFLAGSVAGTAAMPLLGDLVRQDRYQGAY